LWSLAVVAVEPALEILILVAAAVQVVFVLVQDYL
jgi:hypothetical protein